MVLTETQTVSTDQQMGVLSAGRSQLQPVV